MIEKELNQKIRDIVRLATGLVGDAVRPANQDAPAAGQYVTVLITTAARRGQDDSLFDPIENDDVNVRETATGSRDAMASISFIRGNAKELASKFESRITLGSARVRMQELGIGFVSTSAIRTLSSVVNSAWEDRAQIDLNFTYIDTEVDDVPTFAVFPITIHTVAGPDASPTEQTNEVTAP
ncbi:MAG: hypothetical protein E6R08_06410 [Nevskiaceae bacterium]|nr:MAG: hypothetical protein E6R08_06410 [Nevskiaceae bacterium]